MAQSEKDFCFCTLALGSKYRLLTKQLAKDLEKYSPKTFLVVGTDEPTDFANHPNVIAFKQRQTGILHCYHDKRFVIKEALSRFNVAIQIDADTRIVENIPDCLDWLPGITGRTENLIEHLEKYAPERLETIKKVVSKLNIVLENAIYVGESLCIIARDGGKEIEFLNHWDKIANYLQLKGMHSGEGNAIGLAAAKVGWTIRKTAEWEKLRKITNNLDASKEKKPQSFWDKLNRRFAFHYRLNKTRLAALKNFDFYYR